MEVVDMDPPAKTISYPRSINCRAACGEPGALPAKSVRRCERPITIEEPERLRNRAIRYVAGVNIDPAREAGVGRDG